MNRYEVTLVRVETIYRKATVHVNAESDDDARVLAKYERVYEYEWEVDSERGSETQHVETVHLMPAVEAA